MGLFRFSGRLDAGDFALALAIRAGCWFASMLAFPYILFGLISVSGCRGIGGACGALALVGKLWLKPVIFYAFVASLAGITVRRLRDAALPVWLAAVVILLLLGGEGFMTALGAHWSVNFVTGALFALPIAFGVGLLALLALCVFPSRQPGESRSPATRPLAYVMAAILMLVLASPIVATYVWPAPINSKQQVRPDTRTKVLDPTQLARQEAARELMQKAVATLYWNARLQPLRLMGVAIAGLLLAVIVLLERRVPEPPAAGRGPTAPPVRPPPSRQPRVGGPATFGRRQ